MRILITGAGKMGSFFCDLLQQHHQVAIYDPNPQKLLFTFGCERFQSLDQADAFSAQMAINAAPVSHTLEAFHALLSHVPHDCILADIASVKTGLPQFYAASGHPFVSTHPMFGPTFASLSNLSNENAVIISESCEKGKDFFRKLYETLRLNIYDYSFEEHDRTMAYSLSVPFASTLVFGSCMKPGTVPGTTFKRHKAIADGLMGEDTALLAEILFNNHTSAQLQKIVEKLQQLKTIIDSHDTQAMNEFLDQVRERLREDK